MTNPVDVYTKIFLRHRIQDGQGIDQIFRGDRYVLPSTQSGSGIGNVIGSFFRRTVPIYAPVLLKSLLRFGNNLLTDHQDNINISDSLKNRGKEAAIDAASNMMQTMRNNTGRGKKRTYKRRRKQAGGRKKRRKSRKILKLF